MGTRAQIKVEGSAVIFYKHSDGYPSQVLNVLLPLVAEFHKLRGHDDCYLPAHICHAFFAADRKRMAEDDWYKANPGMVESIKFLGYGLDCERHGDTAFLYTVMVDGSVKVEAVGEGRPRLLGTFELGTDPKKAIAKCDGKKSKVA